MFASRRRSRARTAVRPTYAGNAIVTVQVAADVPTTREPTTEELVVIREVLDPKGLRFKEVPDQ